MPDTEDLAIELERNLDQAIALLQRHAEVHWWPRLQAVMELVKQRDVRGLDALRSMYGSMGSINDLVLHPINGHRIRDDEVDAANETLQTHLHRIHELASRLRRYAC